MDTNNLTLGQIKEIGAPERIKELRAMIAGLPNNQWKDILFNDLLEALDTIEARNARIAELEAALNPFANEASEYDQGQFEDRDSPYFNTFNIGQLRTARAALNHIAKALGGACGAPKATAEQAERAVLVTTEFRGVFFGYATDTSGDVIKLRAARNAVYWPSENKGFLGLAETGPLKGARIGPPADIELRKITCVAECTAPAIAAWEAAPWK